MSYGCLNRFRSFPIVSIKYMIKQGYLFPSNMIKQGYFYLMNPRDLELKIM